MRVFITDGTGFIDPPWCVNAWERGYEVVGLARSEVLARALRSAGAAVLTGSA